jgi:large subunit ribosomal protein L9
VEVILLKSVPPLGSRGDKVRVKPGYARNFLFPRRLALPATESNFKIFEEEEKLLKHRDQKAMEAAKALAAKMADVSCTIPVQVGEEDKMYGSVTTHDIAEELAKQGYRIDKKQVLMDEPIKKLGVYKIEVSLHSQVRVPIKVWIVKE